MATASSLSRGHQSSSSSGWTETRVPFYEFHEYRELASRTFRSLEEQLYLKKAQLKRQLGYTVFGEMPMPRKGPIYRLIYASKHERGLEFWDKVTRKELGGQMDLF